MIDIIYIIQIAMDSDKTIWCDAMSFKANNDDFARKVLADFIKIRKNDTVRLWKLGDLKNV
jgi:hypothetical protein